MVRVAVLLLVTACGRVGFAAQSDAGSPTGDGATCFIETFDVLDPLRWMETDPGTSITVAVANGQLVFTPAT